MDGEAYASKARSWSNTPPRVADGSRQDMAAVFKPRGRGRLAVIGELTSGELSYQGNQQGAYPSQPL